MVRELLCQNRIGTDRKGSLPVIAEEITMADITGYVREIYREPPHSGRRTLLASVRPSC